MSELVAQGRKLLNIHNRVRRSARIAEYYEAHRNIAIQFGSGSAHLSGFLNTDLFSRVPVDIRETLPFPSDSVDVLYSNHLVEHIYCYEFKRFLRESLRVLRPAGIHIIGTPSLEKLVGSVYVADDSSRRDAIFDVHEKLMNEKLTPAIFFNRLMHINYGHKFLYDFESILMLARSAGYSEVIKIDNREVPIENIRKLVAAKDEVWDLETETFLLVKVARE